MQKTQLETIIKTHQCLILGRFYITMFDLGNDLIYAPDYMSTLQIISRLQCTSNSIKSELTKLRLVNTPSVCTAYVLCMIMYNRWLVCNYDL